MSNSNKVKKAELFDVKNHFHFVFWAYTSKDPLGNYNDVQTIDLMDNDYENALRRAKKIKEHEFIFLKSLVEHSPHEKE